MHDMVDAIIKSFDIWTDAQGLKSKGRVKSIENISLEGIVHLRELILDLAIRGKLVPQDSSDEPANELLKKITKEKKAFLKEKKINKIFGSAEVDETDQPFLLPEGWAFCRFSTLVNSLISGGTPNKANPSFWNGDIPWASVKDLRASKYIFTTQDYITSEGLAAGSKLAAIDDIIICTRMGLGKIAIAKVPLAINQDLKAVQLTAYINVDYFLLFYRTLKIKGTGTTVSGIKQEELLSYVVPIPPFKEQKHIVAKVEELMALCDKLEAQQTNSLKTHQQLVKTILETLTLAKDADEVQVAWQQLLPHFDTLFCTEDSIEQLKQTLLQLAIMGRLVKQDPKDEPAKELMKRIEKEKDKLVKEGRLKKEKALSEISEAEKPFELPKNWEWVRLGSISDKIGSGSTPRGGSNAYVSSGVIFLRSQNIRNEGLLLDDVTYIDVETNKKMANTVVEPNDILLNITGGSLGRTTVFPKNIETANVSQHVTIIRPTIKDSSIFLHKCILSPYIQGLIWGRQVGANREGLSKKILELFEIPYPPLAEQNRIVEKIDSLFKLCDRISDRISKSQEIQNILSKTIVENAVA